VRLGIDGRARLGRRVLAALVVGPQPLGERPRLARRRHRLVVVVAVVRHAYFGASDFAGSVANGAVLGNAVSLVAGAVVTADCAGATVPAASGVSVAADGGLAGISGVAEAPELL
jgi:hypothetical protein